ncbi:hypothetical protein Tco_1077807, partial [Tanacetum coccineum]
TFGNTQQDETRKQMDKRFKKDESGRTNDSTGCATALETPNSNELKRVRKSSVTEGFRGVFSSNLVCIKKGATVSFVKSGVNKASTEEGGHYPPTTCYDYQYPGVNGMYAQADESGQGYIHLEQKVSRCSMPFEIEFWEELSGKEKLVPDSRDRYLLMDSNHFPIY